MRWIGFNILKGELIMYGHLAKAGFQEMLSNIRYFKEVANMDNVSSRLKNMISGIDDAMHFHLGYFEDQVMTLYKLTQSRITDRIFMNELAYDVRLPSPLMWLDWSTNEENKKKRTIFGSLVKSYGVVDGHELFRIQCTTSSKGRWYVPTMLYLVMVGKNFSEEEIRHVLGNTYTSSEIDFIVNEYSNSTNQIILPFGSHPFHMTKEQKDAYRNYEVTLSKTSLLVLNAFLMMLSCKNIVTEDVIPTRMITKKHRQVKVPDKVKFTYKVLKVKLPKLKQNKPTPNLKEGRTVRLHWRMGHWKIYTAEKPLFGRYVGRWWWQKNLYGNSENGFVDKEYDIEIK